MYCLLYAANEGIFDSVPLDKVALATENLLNELRKKHAKLVATVNTGDKVSDQDNEVILKVAKSIASTYSSKSKESKS
jgi:F0F1-type ATP synthase alpha subunit